MMKTVHIQDIHDGLISGVSVALPDAIRGEQNAYFNWTSAALTASFQTGDVTGGVLKSWRHQPLFELAECHVDDEMFYFLQGTAIMLFVDYIDGQPDADTAQVVRIPAGTQLIIEKGKGHYVAVAETDEPVIALVVAPAMDAPKMPLSHPVLGI